jgi:hypothetical protein
MNLTALVWHVLRGSGILQNQYGGPNVRFWALNIAMQSGLQQCSMRSQNSLEAQMVYT